MNSNKNKIKIILVTGFLGAGKTTFLNRLIDFYSEKKIAMVINDFGKIAIDGILLRDKINDKLNPNIYEITNGSIFCSCLSAELVKALKYFINKVPEVLIVETSGLSDPSTFEKILLDNNLDPNYEIHKSICIVDSTNVLKLHNKITAIDKQIESSIIILVNKSDLIEQEEFKKIEELIKLINKNSLILKTVHSNFELSVLGNTQSMKFLGNSVTYNTVGNRPGSIVLEQKEIKQKEIEKFFLGVAKYILRLKGFLKIEEDTYYISDNNGKLQLEKYDKRRITNFGLSVLLDSENVTMVQKAWHLI